MASKKGKGLEKGLFRKEEGTSHKEKKEFRKNDEFKKKDDFRKQDEFRKKDGAGEEIS